jgi:hypothetical protein
MTTDFRALCAELADELDAETGYTKNNGERITHETVARARAALAEPEPPTDDELYEMWRGGSSLATSSEFISTARAVLARWGR